MSLHEYRASLMLWALVPTYIIYFSLQAANPTWLTTNAVRLMLLAAALLLPALVAVIGAGVRGRHADRGPLSDERDQAIDAHATRAAYWLLMVGAVSVGMGMAFSQGGWKIVNGTLLSVVLAEVLRNILVLRGYRGRVSRLAL